MMARPDCAQRACPHTRRLSGVALAAVVFLGIATLAPGSAAAQIGPGERIDLKDTLEKGLKVRVDRERRFVARVVVLVTRGAFERELVLAIFQKARARHHRFPFAYFRAMMQVIAKKQGLDLPY